MHPLIFFQQGNTLVIKLGVSTFYSVGMCQIPLENETTTSIELVSR